MIRQKELVIIPPMLLLIALVIFLSSRPPEKADDDLPFESHSRDSRSQEPASTSDALDDPLPPKVSISLADLGTVPDWNLLTEYQETMTRSTFLERLITLYTKSNAWKDWISISEKHALIQTHQGPYRINFAKEDLTLPPAPSLSKLHIAIDPGHIGGAFAKLEERYLQYGETPDYPSIQEGAMTLATAKLLKPMLEAHGARVTLVRKKNEPVTETRPSDYNSARLFYRTAEIRARAKLVNETIKPDLVVCLHYNASGSPVPIPGQHFHILINGAYHASELKHEDERFQMLHRLLSRTSEVEIPLSRSLVESFQAITKLPPYRYPANHAFSVNVARNEFIWARNLIANRLYQAPVVYLEPYVMNSTEFMERFKENPKAIYREYAQAVESGILSWASR